MRRCPSWFLFAVIAIATPTFAATTVKTFTISGSLVSWTTATATVFVAIDRDPLDTGDITVDLTADADLRFSCIHCTIPAGQTTLTTVTAQAFTYESVTVNALARVDSPYDNGKPASVSVQALELSVSINPNSLVGYAGQTATGTVTTNGPLAQDFDIPLSPGPGTYAQIDGSCHIAAGQNSGTFSVSAPWPVATATPGSVIATFVYSTASANLTILPFTVQVTLNQPTIRGGQTATGTVKLIPAPAYYTIVSLSADSDPGQVGVSSAAEILAGQDTGTFTYTGGYPSFPVADIITADMSGATGTATVSIYPPDEPYLPCPECEAQAGHPINLLNGNVWIDQKDYALPGLGGGLSLTRTWNSLWDQNKGTLTTAGMFGNNWKSTYEERLVVMTTDSIKYSRANGDGWWFRWDDGNQRYNVSVPQNQHATLAFNTTTTLYTLTFLDGTQRVFNNAGYLIKLVDRNGNQTQVSYDGSNRITQVTDPASRSITFTYADPTFTSVVTSVQDSSGTIATYTYDASSSLTQVVYADGSQLNFNIVGYSSIASVTDAQGVVLESHTYDERSRGLSSSRANGVDSVTVSYTSDGTAHLADSLGNTTDYGSAPVGPVPFTNSIFGPTCNSCGARTSKSFVRDEVGNPTSTTDANGNVTNFTYDSNGNLLTKTSHLADGSNPAWTYTYNSFGEVLTATDPLGHITTNTYDTHGNLLTTTTPSPDGTAPASTTTFTYYTNGTLHTIQDPLTHTSTLDYYTTGLLHTVTDANSKVTTYAYDAHGNRTSIIDPVNGSSHPTTFVYDSMNRLTQINYPTSPATNMQFHYDYRGRRDWVQDQNGKKTLYAYDDADRLVSVTDAQTTPGITQYAYDTENNLTSVTDASGHQTTFAYDPNRRLSQTTFPSSLVESYNYDNNGNLTSKTDRKSNTIYYAYDTLNRLTTKTYPDSSTLAYTYDLANRLTQAVDPTGTYTFSYDRMDRMTQAGVNYAFDTTGNLTVGYGYDKASNRTSMTDPQSVATTYGYDVLNRMSTLSLTGQSFGFGYDDLSRRTSLTRNNTLNTSYSYDPVSRLLSVLHKVGATTKDGATYVYDSAGNRTTRTDNRTSTTLTYTYDDIYQLKTAKQGTTTKETYTYDAVGNRLSSLGVTPYSYNSSNELTSIPGTTYTYDNNGNTATKVDGTGTTSYTWDFENRLTQVTLPGTGGTVTFKYDPFGRRVQKSFTVGTTTTVTNYVHDDRKLLEELNQNGTVIAKYTQGPGIDEALAELRGSTTSFYEMDFLGSITSLSNSAGALASTYTYDSYGKLTASTGTIVNPFRYAGREFDSETGLYNYRFRYYDSTIGRFLVEDPIKFDGGINFFRYADGNPVSEADPLGLDTRVCYYPSSNQPWGHIGFGLPGEGDPGTSGFYPTGNPFDSPGKVKPDAEHKPAQCKNIPAPKDKDQCMLQCRLDREKNPGDYKVFSRQCTSFVRDCLKKCGEPTGNYDGPRPWPFFDGLPK